MVGKSCGACWQILSFGGAPGGCSILEVNQLVCACALPFQMACRACLSTRFSYRCSFGCAVRPMFFHTRFYKPSAQLPWLHLGSVARRTCTHSVHLLLLGFFGARLTLGSTAADAPANFLSSSTVALLAFGVLVLQSFCVLRAASWLLSQGKGQQSLMLSLQPHGSVFDQVPWRIGRAACCLQHSTTPAHHASSLWRA